MATTTRSYKRACRASPDEAWQVLLSVYDEFVKNAAEMYPDLEKKHLSISAHDPELTLGARVQIAWRRFTILRAVVTGFEPNQQVEVAWRIPLIRGTGACEVEPNGSGSLLRASLSLPPFWARRLLTSGQQHQSETEIDADFLQEWAELAERIHDERIHDERIASQSGDYVI